MSNIVSWLGLDSAVAGEGRRRRLSRESAKWHRACVSNDQLEQHNNQSDIDETHLTSSNEYFEMSLANSDDNENSIHFIDDNNEFEYIEEQQVEKEESQQHDHENDENAGETYYTIEIEDDFDTDFEKDSLVAWKRIEILCVARLRE